MSIETIPKSIYFFWLSSVNSEDTANESNTVIAKFERVQIWLALFFETPILRFALLCYCRWNGNQ